MRSSAASLPSSWLCVQGRGCWDAFPLTGGLPSLPSPPGDVFGDFVGTMPPSDCLCPCLLGFRPETSRGRLLWEPADTGSPDSRAACVCACLGSPTPPGLDTPRPSGVPRVAFRALGPRRHPEVSLIFRGSLPSLHLPLSTLRRRRYRRPRMTRSRGGWLDLPRRGLSPLTPCRF